jgi:hypothetical protein
MTLVFVVGVICSISRTAFAHHMGKDQCCQLAEISAAKHKSGTIKIAAAGRNGGRIFCRFFQKLAEKWPNFFAVCSSHKSLDYLQK